MDKTGGNAGAVADHTLGIGALVIGGNAGTVPCSTDALIFILLISSLIFCISRNSLCSVAVGPLLLFFPPLASLSAAVAVRSCGSRGVRRSSS